MVRRVKPDRFDFAQALVKIALGTAVLVSGRRRARPANPWALAAEALGTVEGEPVAPLPALDQAPAEPGPPPGAEPPAT